MACGVGVPIDYCQLRVSRGCREQFGVHRRILSFRLTHVYPEDARDTGLEEHVHRVVNFLSEAAGWLVVAHFDDHGLADIWLQLWYEVDERRHFCPLVWAADALDAPADTDLHE